jgi:hypothetical protein
MLEIHHLTRPRFLHTVWWAVLLSALIIGVVATLGRAAANVKAALTDKPDIAVYLLLEDEGVTQSTLLRGRALERDYLVETRDGPRLVKLKKGEEEWFVASVETLHE